VESRDPSIRSRARASATDPAPVPVEPLATAPDNAATTRAVGTGRTHEQVPKLTLLLVLGHHFERLVRNRIVKDYAEIARRTGLTRARLTQIVNLTLLAPEIQETILRRVLCADGDETIRERAMRGIVAEPDWTLQRRLGKLRGL